VLGWGTQARGWAAGSLARSRAAPAGSSISENPTTPPARVRVSQLRHPRSQLRSSAGVIGQALPAPGGQWNASDQPPRVAQGAPNAARRPTRARSSHKAVSCSRTSPAPAGSSVLGPPSTLWLARRFARTERAYRTNQHRASADVKFRVDHICVAAAVDQHENCARSGSHGRRQLRFLIESMRVNPKRDHGIGVAHNRLHPFAIVRSARPFS
jgi:hypothetical protein